MNAIRTIIQNDLKIFFASPGNLVSLIVLPIAFTLVLGWAFSGSGDDGPQRIRVDVLDQDQTPAAASLLDEIRGASDAFVLCPMDNDDDDFCRLEEAPLTLDLGQERAQSERTAALLVIPEGYGAAVSEFGQTELHLYAAGNPGLPNSVQETLNAVLQKLNTATTTANVLDAMLTKASEQSVLGDLIAPIQPGLVNAVYLDAAERIQNRDAAVRYQTTTGDEGSDPAPDQGFGQSVPGMGTMYVMFTVLGATSVLLRERNQWTLQRLAALPISRAQILSGKIITYLVLGMIQFLIIFAVGLVVGLDFGRQPLLLLPIMVAFVLCITALAFAIAPWMKNLGQAEGVARLLALAFAPLGGAWWPLEIVPDFMRTIGHLSPVAWAMDAFHDIMWYSGGVAEILPEIGVLMAASAILFFVGVRSFQSAITA